MIRWLSRPRCNEVVTAFETVYHMQHVVIKACSAATTNAEPRSGVWPLSLLGRVSFTNCERHPPAVREPA